VLIRNKTDQQMRDVIEGLARTPGLTGEMTSKMNEVCDYFDDLIALLVAACERVETTAKAMGL